MSFSSDIRKFNQKAGKNIGTVVKKTAFDITKALILETPVDKGTAKRNWFLSMNTPVVQFVNEQDPTGSKTVAEVNIAKEAYRLGDDIWVTNSTPYIIPLNNGTSDQRPRGWVDRIVRQANRLAKKAATQL